MRWTRQQVPECLCAEGIQAATKTSHLETEDPSDATDDVSKECLFATRSVT